MKLNIWVKQNKETDEVKIQGQSTDPEKLIDVALEAARKENEKFTMKQYSDGVTIFGNNTIHDVLPKDTFRSETISIEE